MAAQRRYGETPKSRILRFLYFFLFGITAIWLLASIVFKTSPVELISSSVNKIEEKVSESIPNADLIDQETKMHKDSLINKLKDELAICKGEKSYSKAMVIINSNHLNMRDKASLSSSIVMQIPAESIVDILYYDTETFYLEGKPGKWARIKYANEEGWVWGNFLKQMDEDLIPQ